MQAEAGKAAKEDMEGLRAKLRGAVKKGKAIEKARADLEDTVSMLHTELEVKSFPHYAVTKTLCQRNSAQWEKAAAARLTFTSRETEEKIPSWVWFLQH